MDSEAKWYVAHTYSGYENKVKDGIEAAVESRSMHHLIEEVFVPMYEVEETKGGQRKLVMKKVFPGYVLVKMILTDESWYVVRNTRGVTGFVGPGSKPVPLSSNELRSLGIKEKMPPSLDVRVGDSITILAGPFEGFSGNVEEVNMEKRKIKANISMFGRETPVELEYSQIAKN